jgi:hypothetical protein
MSFDAYHKWLGIPPDEQPPNHYRLLGISLFESDADVISHAADQRMAHVRSFQAGKRAEYSQRILNEVATARVCLLDPEKKAEYDAALRARLAPAPTAARVIPTAVPLSPAVPSGAAPASPPPPPPTPPSPVAAQTLAPSASQDQAPADQPVQVLPVRYRPGSKYLPMAIVAAVGAVAVIVLLTYLAATGAFGGREVAQESVDSPPKAVVPSPSGPPGNGGVVTDEPPGENGSDPPPVTGSANGEEGPPPTDGSATTQAGHPQEDVNEPATGEGQDSNGPTAADGGNGVVPGEQTTGTTETKSPQPDNDSVTSARQRLEATLSDELPQQLIARVSAQTRSGADTFAILSMAKDRAAASGDVQTALAAVDELDARFEVDTFDTRTTLVTQLAASANEEADHRGQARLALTLVDEAVKRGRNELARDLAARALAAARKSGDSDLVRKVTLTIVRLQQP